jgi:amino acid transporter
VALAFSGYFRAFVELPSLLVSGGLLLVTTAVCLVGVRQSTVMTAVFTVVEATGLILVIVVGASSERFGDALSNVTPGWNLFGGAALVFFSYLGFENIANLAEEAKEPGRTLPLAILVSLAASTVLYVLVALAAVALLSPAELAASDAPLADAVRSSSPRIAGALGGIALFATANTALAAILSASRVLFGMARDGALPGRLATILPRRKTPWLATLVVAGSALALLPLGEVAIVASISSFAALSAFVAVNVALIVLRYSQPAIERPFRVPLSVRGFAVLPAIGAATALLLISQLDGTAILAGTGLLVVVLGLRAVIRRR